MLDESSVYQYSVVSDNWEIFVKNTVVDFATKDHAGVVQVGDGLEITSDGILSVEDENRSNADWSQNDPSGAGYVKNRTHYSGTETSKISLNDAELLDDTLYPKVRGSSYVTMQSEGYPPSDVFYVKISDETPSIEELTSSDSAYWVYEEAVLDSSGNKYPIKEKKMFNNAKAYYRDANGTTNSTLTAETAYSASFTHNVGPHNVGPVIAYKANAKIGTYTYNASSSATKDIILPEPGIYARMHIWFGTIGSTDPDHKAYSFITELSMAGLDRVKKLEWKYLPEDVASQQWVLDNLGQDEQADWKMGDANDASFIRNKPFGILPILDAYNTSMTKEEKQAMIDNASSTKKFTYASDTYIWIGDTFKSLEEVKKYASSINLRNGSNGEIASGISNTKIINDTMVIYTSNADGSKVENVFAVVENSSTYDRGVYVRVRPNLELDMPSHIWTSETYEADLPNLDDSNVGWTGTLAEYNAVRDTLDEGTKVFITDDETDLANVKLNGSPLKTTDSFYAPTTAGKSGQVLVSQGEGKAPVWQDAATFVMACGKNASYSSNSSASSYSNASGINTSNMVTTNSSVLEATSSGFLVKKSGYYFAQVNLLYYRNGSSGTMYMRAGSKFTASELSYNTVSSNGGSGYTGFGFSSIAYLNTGDYIVPQFRNTAAVSTSLSRIDWWVIAIT